MRATGCVDLVYHNSNHKLEEKVGILNKLILSFCYYSKHGAKRFLSGLNKKRGALVMSSLLYARGLVGNLSRTGSEAFCKFLAKATAYH